MAKKNKCKNNNKSKRFDAGYYDKYRGWYDVQECGRCNDYCRWVGNSGSGGNPAKRTRKKKKGKGKSWWSCRLGNKKKSYSNRNKWRNGFRYKKCIKEGAKSNLPLEGNKSKYGGGKNKYDKHFPSINKLRNEAKKIANNGEFKIMLKNHGIIIPTNINKLLDKVTQKDFFNALNLFESKEEKKMKGGGNTTNNEEEVCPICLEEIGTRRLCGICLPESNTIPQGMWPYRCGHYNKHCMDCYYQLFNNSPTCPLCRAEMYPVDHARRRVGRCLLRFMRRRAWIPETFDDWTDVFAGSMFVIVVLSIALNRSDESLSSRGGIDTAWTLFDTLLIMLTLWLFYKAMMNQRRQFDDDINDLMNGLYGGRKRRKKTRRKRGGENDHCMAYNKKWWNTNGNNVIRDEQRKDLNKAHKYCRHHANFENDPGGGRYFPLWKCQVSTGECFDEEPSLAPGQLTRTENATTFLSYDPDDPAAHVFNSGGGRRRRRRKPIRINPKMRGVFTKKAKKKGMSVQRYANYVIKKYKGKKKTKKQLKLLRQAVFAKTAKKWKKRRGGGKKRKRTVKHELKHIWNREQKKTKKRKRGNKDMNTTELMKAMNSPVKRKIKRNNQEFRRERDKWIKEELQQGIYNFASLFLLRFGDYLQKDIMVYDIKRRKSLNLKQEHPTPDKVIEDYMKNTDKARLKVVFMNNYINSANKEYRKKIKQNFWDDNPLYVKRYYENNKAMSQDSKGNWRKKDAIIHSSQQATGDFRGRKSPIPMAGDPSKTVSLVMTRADDKYFFNRPG